jgi:hypothetical protein
VDETAEVEDVDEARQLCQPLVVDCKLKRDRAANDMLQTSASTKLPSLNS